MKYENWGRKHISPRDALLSSQTASVSVQILWQRPDVFQDFPYPMSCYIDGTSLDGSGDVSC